MTDTIDEMRAVYEQDKGHTALPPAISAPR
jgi:hypothetical protein